MAVRLGGVRPLNPTPVSCGTLRAGFPHWPSRNLGQDGVPQHPIGKVAPPTPDGLRRPASRLAYSAASAALIEPGSTRTPGPMVEVTATFLR